MPKKTADTAGKPKRKSTANKAAPKGAASAVSRGEPVKPKKTGPSRDLDESDLMALGDDLVEFMRDEKQFWLKSFCIENRFPAQYLTRYAERSEYFARCLEMAKDIQEERLVRLGLTGNSAMPIFALKNVSKWRDKPDESGARDDLSKVFAAAAKVMEANR